MLLTKAQKPTLWKMNPSDILMAWNQNFRPEALKISLLTSSYK